MFDHVSHKIKVVSHIRLDGGSVEEAYTDAVGRIERLAERLDRPLLMERRAAHGQVEDSPTYTSNMSQERYEAMVEQVKSTSTPATSFRRCHPSAWPDPPRQRPWTSTGRYGR